MPLSSDCILSTGFYHHVFNLKSSQSSFLNIISSLYCTGFRSQSNRTPLVGQEIPTLALHLEQLDEAMISFGIKASGLSHILIKQNKEELS